MIVKESANLTRYNRAISRRFTPALKTTGLLVPFALAGLAGAEGTDGAAQLADAAKTGMTGIVALIVGILVVGIGVSVLFFANRKTKKGINQAG